MIGVIDVGQMSGDANQVCQRGHNRHTCHRLAGTGRDEEINSGLNQEHRNSGDGSRKLGKRDRQVVYDSIDNMACLENHQNAAGNTYHHTGNGNLGEALRHFLGYFIGPQPMMKPLTSPIKRNTALSSAKYHPLAFVPHTITTIPATRVANTSFSLIPNGLFSI